MQDDIARACINHDTVQIYNHLEDYLDGTDL